MFGSCRQTLMDVPEGREALPDVQQLSGGPPECPEVVRRPSRMSGSSREDLSGVRE